jgi:hypothetical protein
MEASRANIDLGRRANVDRGLGWHLAVVFFVFLLYAAIALLIYRAVEAIA